MLKTHANQYQVIAGGGAIPSLAEAKIMNAPDSASLPANLDMARRGHTWIRVFLVTLFWPYHLTALAKK